MTHSFRKKAVQGLKPGDCFVYTRQFSKEESWAFGDLTRDYNPVHYDSRWTGAKGFKGLICHGLLVGGMICEFGGQVGWLATGMEFKFIRPVYFNDRIECRVTLTRIEENGRAEAEAEFFNQEGIRVCLARLTGRLPLEDEKQILSRMMEEGDPTNKLS
ncbi:MaoC/PaaZ C-terminal domain-containing protein [Desulfospira joergensenii]|uniref:MaoC/PaaZ C-terminal domain-containing protein n=1 Tax=Desulfospira joergensenii TaxID=53329 RepID=UPI0003B6EF57|nr:MaoC/PaaZ C-terminal domain-containing protein [Desulfospira joergensenii]